MDRRTLMTPGGFRAAPAAAVPGWSGAAVVAVLMIVVIAVRLHELVPGLALIKPGLLAAFGGTGLILYHSSAAGRSALLRHPLFRLTMFYWLFIIVTVPFAMWQGLAVGTVQYFLPGVALVMAILLCRPENRSLVVLQAGFVAAAAVFAIYAKLFGRVLDGRLAPGIGMYDSNDMAAIMGLTFPLAVGLFMKQRGALRLLGIGAGLLLAAVVLASGSRGGMLGLGAGAVVLALGLKGPGRVLALAAFVITAAAMWTFSPSFNERMSSLTSLETDYNATDEVGRKAVWARGRQYIRDNPAFGVGAGNFPVAEGRYFDLTYQGMRGGKWSSAHNAYVQAYAELGVVGGTIFVALLLYGVRVGWRLWRGVRRAAGFAHRPEFLASLCAFMVSAVFLSHAYFLPLMALLGLMALAERTLLLDRAPGSGAGSAAMSRAGVTPGGRTPWIPAPSAHVQRAAPVADPAENGIVFGRRRPRR
jgi:putative inorganic carbon (hco3(-)) transporter